MVEERLKRVTWQFTDECNIVPACGYCIRGESTIHPDIDVTKEVIRGLARLKGIWRISFTGGEPTAVPEFFSEVIPFFLGETSHLYSLVTNFTAEQGDLVRLAIESGDRLERLCASYHLKFNEPDSFIEKAVAVDKACSESESEFKVFCVLIPNKLGYIADELAPRFHDVGLKTYFQMLKLRKKDQPAVKFQYTPEQMEVVRKIVGPEANHVSLNPGRSYKGHECFAGVNYFVMNPRGDVFLCYDAKDQGAPPIGNIREGFKPNSKPVICQYDICSCGSPFLDGNIITSK
jgi:MoaA/NifB/PqqE/SkfB family radical SAM enzyme